MAQQDGEVEFLPVVYEAGAGRPASKKRPRIASSPGTSNFRGAYS
jgi:hypothetical protein